MMTVVHVFFFKARGEAPSVHRQCPPPTHTHTAVRSERAYSEHERRVLVVTPGRVKAVVREWPCNVNVFSELCPAVVWFVCARHHAWVGTDSRVAGGEETERIDPKGWVVRFQTLSRPCM